MELEENVMEHESVPSKNNQGMALLSATRIRAGTRFVVVESSKVIQLPIGGQPGVGIDRISTRKLKIFDHNRTFSKKQGDDGIIFL